MWNKYYEPELLYKILHRMWFKRPWYRTIDLGEGMTVMEKYNVPACKEVTPYWWQAYLLNENTKHAWKITDEGKVFIGDREDDDNDFIDWKVMRDADLSYAAYWRMAEHQCSILPVNVKPYRDGVAEVVWQINPNNKMLSDFQGYPASDIEVNLHAFIDKEANILVKFRTVKGQKDLKNMEWRAMEILRKRTDNKKS